MASQPAVEPTQVSHSEFMWTCLDLGIEFCVSCLFHVISFFSVSRQIAEAVSYTGKKYDAIAVAFENQVTDSLLQLRHVVVVVATIY